jgi:hypothetical protein
MATAAEEQLRLEISETEAPPAKVDSVDLALAWLDAYHGDYHAVIIALLEDADFLRDQLYTASCAMSSGLTRGWRPKYERVPS